LCCCRMVKKKKNKSCEDDIRKAIVLELLKRGIKRKHIRLEIPLDTASSCGRADIVILTNKIGCIELKSGKDKYCQDALKKQMEGYKRAFDGILSCVDVSHRRIKEVKDNSYTGYHTESNWQQPDLQYCHESKQVQCMSGGEPYDFIGQMFRFQGRNTSTYDMARMLWKCEAQEIIGYNGNKWDIIQDMRENGVLSKLRPKIIKQLKSRPLNEWEIKFWDFFDGNTKDMFKMAIR